MNEQRFTWMTDEEMAAALTRSFEEVAEYLRREFNPIVKQATRAVQDFAFSIWLLDQPRWQRPLMRLGEWLYRQVVR